MKKIIIIIVFSICYINAFSQVAYNKPQKPTFEWLSDILHTFNTDAYDLYIDSDNRFEEYSIVIKLGRGKEQALKSLETIKKMFDECKEDYTIRLGGHLFTKKFGEIVAFVPQTVGKYVITSGELYRWIGIFKPTEVVSVEYSLKGRELITYIEDSNKELEEEESIPFYLVEEKPSFNGGDANEFSNWVNSQLVYPQDAKEKGIQGRVTLQFIIEEDGSVTNVKVLRGVDKALNDEAVRVVSSSPKWKSAQQRGKNCRVTYTFPVIFSLK